MTRLKRLGLFPLPLVLIACLWAGTRVPADEPPLQQLQQLLGVQLDGWSRLVGDPAGAEQPAFDDHDWKQANLRFRWHGDNSVCWFRKQIVLPERIATIPVSGAKVILRVGIDDEGELFVNGESRGKFTWDRGETVLTESARPGQRFLVAIRGVNHGGPGELLRAELDCGIGLAVREPVTQFLGRIELIRQMVSDQAHPSPKLLATFRAAMGRLDFASLRRGDNEGFTRSLAAAEQGLEALSPFFKEYVCQLVGHAHIDMNWLWLWPETVQVCQNTFRDVLNLMNDVPGLCFSQSQPSTYLAVQQTRPDLFRAIARRIHQGRWEVTGGTWVECDMNLPSGEAIARQILYAKRYFRSKFGVDVRICWSPDTFGHAWSVPQILKKGGIDYYYLCRCGPEVPLFWWQGIEGSRVLAYYSDRGYNQEINPTTGRIPFEVERASGVKQGMAVYGAGDHGGGPRRSDVAQVKQLSANPLFPTLRYGGAQQFFDRALKAKRDFPVVNRELNYVFEGCYTSHSDIKLMNRRSENLLPTAEAFSALAVPYGVRYPKTDFVTAWRNTCFNQFHDILDGTAIHGSYDYSRQLYEQATGLAQQALDKSLRAIAAKVDTLGDGQAVIVFNPLSWERTDRVSVSFDYPMEPMSVTDDRGRLVPCVFYGNEVQSEIIFIAQQVPALGYRTYHLRPAGNQPVTSTVNSLEGKQIENEFLRVTVDRQAGCLTSVYDKRAGRELLPPGGPAAVLQALMEEAHGMSAWNIGRLLSTEELTKPTRVEVIDQSPIAMGIKFDYQWRSSKFSQTFRLTAGVPRLDMLFWADWQELGSGQTGGAMIKVAFPIQLNKPTATFEIPFAAIERPTDGHEVPAQKWADLSDGSYGTSLLNDCKYGHDANGNVLRLTLLRASDDPDPKPDQGQHELTYALYPHKGKWSSAGTVERAYELNVPLIATTESAHPGSLPTAHSFATVEPAGLVVTALKQSEDGNDLILRFYESRGQARDAKVTLNLPVKSVREADLMERPTGSPLSLRNRTLTLRVKPWEIKTLRIVLSQA